MDNVISLDIGTTSITALALALKDGRILTSQTVPNDSTVPNLSGHRHEQDPNAILNASLNLIQSVASSLPRDSVRGVALTGQMHGVLLVSPDFKPLTPLITWRDQRTLEDESAGSLADSRWLVPVETARRCGCRINAGYGGATLRWLISRNLIPPQARALAIPDFIAANLCGAMATDYGFAASWGLLDLTTLDWDGDAIDALGIPRAILPTPIDSGQTIGVIRPDVAARLGIPPQTPVCAPLGDNQASVIGVSGFRNEMVVNIGTGAQISIPCNRTDIRDDMETRPFPGKKALLVAASLCGGWAYDYLCQFFRQAVLELTGTDISKDEIYSRMEFLAKPDSGGLKADTRFAGTRAQPEKRGALVGIGTENLSVGHLSRAVSAGIVEELAAFADAAGLLGILPIAASGNGVRKNPLVQDEIRRQFGSCRLRRVSEEAALGAAYNAAIALGAIRREDVNRWAGETE